MPDSTANPLIAELSRLPDRLARLLDGRSEAELRAQAGSDDWSAKEIACHLREAARIYHERLHRTATEDEPQLAAYEEATLARDLRYQELDTALIVPELRAWREQTVALLAGLPSEAWERLAYHAEVGDMTLVQIATHMVEHEADHLRGLARLLPGAAHAFMVPA